jgi:hypothetical protein
MSTDTPIADRLATLRAHHQGSALITALSHLAAQVHVGRTSEGHSEEVHFDTCPHEDCRAIKAVLDEG